MKSIYQFHRLNNALETNPIRDTLVTLIASQQQTILVRFREFGYYSYTEVRVAANVLCHNDTSTIAALIYSTCLHHFFWILNTMIKKTALQFLYTKTGQFCGPSLTEPFGR